MNQTESEEDTVQVSADTLWEIEKLLSSPERRLNLDAECNDNLENRLQSSDAKEDLEKAKNKLSDLRDRAGSRGDEDEGSTLRRH
jgi:PIN domain nuclease of toxin-antitoxin system